MAYARYFKRNGKKFGPYYYESYRDKNGKIKKRYIGREDPDKKLKLNTDFGEKIKENADSSFGIEEGIINKTPEIVTPINSSLKIFLILVIILFLINISFLLYIVI